jgi:hypothetical protein
MRMLLALVLTAAALAQQPNPGPPVCTRVRFYPAPKSEQAMLGGQFQGSNTSPSTGFQTLAEIKTAPPAGEWTDLTLDNHTLYRWLRYAGPAGSYGKIAEVEFYSGDRKISGPGAAYGSVGKFAPHSWQQAFDGNPKSWVESDLPDNQFVAVDLRDAVTARTPAMDPAPAEYPEPTAVTLKCPTSGATIRYTLDGSAPTATHGLTYTLPIRADKTTTIVAVALLEGRAPSPQAIGTYLITPTSKPGFSTFHLGNSLTQTTAQFAKYAGTAGYRHEAHIFAMPGAPTIKLWNVGLKDEKERWDKIWNSVPRVDHLTLQPRDFNVPEEADYCIRFINLAREKSPDLQPWLYTEWTEAVRQRPTDKGEVPSSQMKKLYPALTWEESMSAMLLYVEELQTEIAKTYHDGKRPRVLPSALAMGWVHHLIETGQFPGLAPGSFYPVLYRDQVHPNPNGAYLVDLTFYSAFYRESGENKVLPIATDWTQEQAHLLERLAWDVIKNYPDAGLYEEGTKPVAKPQFKPEGNTITLHCKTEGAWFRYTLDGTEPTRTKGYVYCGLISKQPGIKLKAIAYKSGMKDSEVVELR